MNDKFLALVEIDFTKVEDRELITKLSNRIDTLGPHVIPKRFINMECVETHEGIMVMEKIWGPDDTYHTVEIQTDHRGYVDVILLPGRKDSPLEEKQQ